MFRNFVQHCPDDWIIEISETVTNHFDDIEIDDEIEI